MSQNPPPPNDDIRLSESEIRAMSQNLRRSGAPLDRGVPETLGSAVIGGVEGMFRRILVLLRIPLIIAAAIIGFIVFNSLEGASFLVAAVVGVIAGVVAATAIGGILRFIDLRAYRRQVR